MMNNKKKPKIEAQCHVCQTRFDVWISENKHTPEVEERIKQQFHRYCPVCQMTNEEK